jgi:hypothetical protein
MHAPSILILQQRVGILISESRNHQATFNLSLGRENIHGMTDLMPIHHLEEAKGATRNSRDARADGLVKNEKQVGFKCVRSRLILERRRAPC